MHKRKHFGPMPQDDPVWDPLEAQWMAQMASGNPAVATPALESLYTVYDGAIRRRLNYFRIEPHDADDIAQQVWIDVVKDARRYTRDVPVHLFVQRHLARGITRHFRRQKNWRQRLSSLSDEAVQVVAEHVVEALFASRADSPHYLALALCVRHAFAAFERKHPDLANLLIVRHVHELSLAEIAADLDDRPDAVKSDLYCARRKFEPQVRHCLELWPDREPAK